MNSDLVRRATMDSEIMLHNNVCFIEQTKYEEVLNLYYNYIILVSELIRSFNLPNDSLCHSILLNRLINSGFLSFNNKFDPDFDEYDELESCKGLKVVLGSGCCRNISGFHKDVFDALGEYSKEFYCYESSSRLFTKQKRANHVINLIRYNDGLIGYDAFNDVIYNFINGTQLRGERVYSNSYLTYKPHFEYLYYNASESEINKNIEMFKNNSHGYVLYDNFVDLGIIVEQAMKEYSYLINDFNNEVTPVKNKIRHLFK